MMGFPLMYRKAFGKEPSRQTCKTYAPIVRGSAGSGRYRTNPIHRQLVARRSDLILENVGIVSDWDSGSDFLRLASGGGVDTLRIRQIASFPDLSYDILGVLNFALQRALAKRIPSATGT